jgi:GTPase
MSTEPHKPLVAIIGRANVGKSTLFNRLVEDQKSLVSAVAGTTRDRNQADCLWRGQIVSLVDTGGLDVDRKDEIESSIEVQARKALAEADAVLFVVDVQSGLQSEDQSIAKELKKLNKPVLVVANKADNAELRAQLNEKEWHNWSFSDMMPVSARQGTGAGDLLDTLYDALKEINLPPIDIQDVTSVRVSVIGRPNVGKSSLLNKLLGHERFIAADQDHTTREPSDTMIAVDGQNYTLVDTAGIRKLAKVRAGKSKLERSGVDRSLRAARRSDVVLLVLDISRRIHVQDKFLGGELEKAGVSVIIIANKWDKIPDKGTNTINDYEEYVRAHMPMLSWAPIVFTSAITGKRVQGLFDMIDTVFRNRFTQLSRDEARDFIRQAIVKHKPSRGKGVAHPKILFFEQGHVNPPTFYLGIKQGRVDVLHQSYLKFLKNLLRRIYEFKGTPIRISIKARKKKHTTV